MNRLAQLVEQLADIDEQLASKSISLALADRLLNKNPSCRYARQWRQRLADSLKQLEQVRDCLAAVLKALQTDHTSFWDGERRQITEPNADKGADRSRDTP